MPLNELIRLKEIQRFLHLEINEEKELRDIVQIAAEICQVTTAMVKLLDEQTGEVLFQIGYGTENTDSFCDYVTQQQRLVIIADSKYPSSSDQDFKSADTAMRFYAGAPLLTLDGHCLGSLCVMDDKPGRLNNFQIRILEVLTRQIIRILEFTMSIGILKDQYIQAKKSETKMRSFFESSASCHLLLDPNFKILAFNKALEEFVHHTLNVGISEGMDIRSVVHPANRESFIENYQTALAGNVVNSEMELDYTAKSICWYMVYEPAYNAAGDIIGVSYNATDISERIRQERLVIAQNKSLKEIAFIQSHELRRPVSSILGLMDLIENEDYYASRDDMILLKQIVGELDVKIRKIVKFTARLNKRVS